MHFSMLSFVCKIFLKFSPISIRDGSLILMYYYASTYQSIKFHPKIRNNNYVYLDIKSLVYSLRGLLRFRRECRGYPLTPTLTLSKSVRGIIIPSIFSVETIFLWMMNLSVVILIHCTYMLFYFCELAKLRIRKRKYIIIVRSRVRGLKVQNRM